MEEEEEELPPCEISANANIEDVFGLNSIEIDGVEIPLYSMVFLNVQTVERVRRWLGVLNNNRYIGCGLNVLAFMGLMSRYDAEQELLQIDRVNGLSIEAVVYKFNHLFQAQEINVMAVAHSTEIETREQLEQRFTYFINILEYPDSFLIIRFGRHDDPAQRPLNNRPDPQVASDPEYIRQYNGNIPMSAGHYVIFYKSAAEELGIIDPHRLIFDEYKVENGISEQFWDLWHNVNGYVSIDILKCYNIPSDRSGGGSKKGVREVPPEGGPTTVGFTPFRIEDAQYATPSSLLYAERSLGISTLKNADAFYKLITAHTRREGVLNEKRCKSSPVYIVPNKITNQFIKELLNSYKCNNSRKSSKKKKRSKHRKPVQGGRKTRKAV